MAIYHDVMSGDYAGIARNFCVNPESCDNPKHYADFITMDCFADHKLGMGVTHVFIDENEETKEKVITGYITLRASSLTMEVGDQHKHGYPALEIAELAVDKRYEGMGLGTDLVKFAINEAVELNETQIGVQYVVLCADTAAVGFYENKKLGFSKIRQMQDIPREHRNENCVPMMLKIAEN